METLNYYIYSLGAPTNKYLLFVNNDKDLEGEVEIMMV